MKGRRQSRARVFATIALSALPASAPAGTWDGGSAVDDNWSNPINWVGNVAPATNGTETVTFAGSTRLTPNLDVDWSVASLNFTSTAGAFVLSSVNNAHTLTIGSGGITHGGATAGNTQTISHGVRLGASQTWTADSGDLLLDRGIDLNGNTLSLGSGFNRNIVLSGNLAGTGNVIVNSAGMSARIAGSSAKTFSGLTTVQSGTLYLEKGVTNTSTGGNVVVGDHLGIAGDARLIQPFGRSEQIPDTAAVTIKSDAVWTLFGNVTETIASLALEGGAVNGGGTINLGGPLTSANTGFVPQQQVNINLGGVTRTFDIANPSHVLMMGVISNGGMDKTGAGHLRLHAANTFAGGVNIAAGEVRLGHNNGLGTGAVTLAAGTALRSDTVSVTIPNNVVLSGNASLGDANTTSLTVNGTVSGAFRVNKVGTGSLLLNGFNTFSGGLRAQDAGTIHLGSNTAAGTGTITIGGSTLQAFGGARTIANNVDFVGGSTGSRIDGAHNLTLNGVVTGSFNKLGTGTVRLTNPANTAGAGVYAGSVVFAAPIPAAAGVGFVLDETGGVVFEQPAHLTGSVGLQIGTGTTITTHADTTFAGEIYSAGRLFKQGLGSLTLTNSTNSYTGVTTVAAGNLIVTADHVLGGAAATVLSGGTSVVLKGGVNYATPEPLVLDNETTTGLLADGGNNTWAGGISWSQFNVLVGRVGTATAASSLTLTGTVNTTGGRKLIINGPGHTQLNGAITGSGGVIMDGPGTATLLNVTNTYTGGTTLAGGTLIIDRDEQLGSTSGSGNTIGFTGGALRSRGVNSNRNLLIGPAGGTLDTDGADGSFGNVTGSGTFTKTGEGALFVRHFRNGGVHVAAGRLALFQLAGNNATSRTDTLSIAPQAQLDLADAKLILRAGNLGSWDGSAYDGVAGMIQRGRNGGASIWTGTGGIITSQVDAAPGLTTLAVATAGQTGYAGGTFGGLTSIAANDVLVMYTYAGDANLDGFISGDDYSAIDFNFAVAGAFGYANGDFNYDGIISGDDYSVIDFNIVAQGAPFPTGSSSAGSAGVTAVPEPAACGFALLAACILRRQRRRRRTRASDRE